jgi:hypothetical protein
MRTVGTRKRAQVYGYRLERLRETRAKSLQKLNRAETKRFNVSTAHITFLSVMRHRATVRTRLSGVNVNQVIAQQRNPEVDFNQGHIG